MELMINKDRIKGLRNERWWSQRQLATAVLIKAVSMLCLPGEILHKTLKATYSVVHLTPSALTKYINKVCKVL